MKTAELIGLELDYWLAMAEGKAPERFDRDGHGWVRCKGDLTPYSASSWAIAGPIIFRERIATGPDDFDEQKWHAEFKHLARADGVQRTFASGPTPQVAAMRAYLALKMGDEVPSLPPGNVVRRDPP